MKKTQTTPRAGRVLLAAAGALGLAVLPLQASTADFAPQDLQTRCTGEAPAVTVPNDLFVPAGQTCLLDGTTIQGDVDVRAGANLVLQNGASVEGNLLVRADAYTEVTDGIVAGTSQLRGAFGAYTDAATLGGVDVRNSGFFYADDSQVGDYLSRNSETSLQSVWVGGDLDARGGTMSDVHDSVITGRLTVFNAAQGSVVCASEVDDSAQFRGNAGLVQIGGDTDCGSNVFGDDLTLRDNTATQGTDVTGAIIRGDLVCSGNDPAPTGSDNRVRGAATGQCAALQPAAGSLMGTYGAQERTTDTDARIQERSTQAHTQAEHLGAANLG